MGRRWTEADIPALDGKVALVTGANSGLGREAARMLARHGARVVMACRNLAKAEEAADDIRSTAGGDVVVVPLDLADLASVAAASDHVAAHEPRLDVLLNDAGLMAVDHATTADGFEMQLGVNHLGHFALTARLAPLLLATPASRVVNVSSMGHRLGRLRLDDPFFEARGYDRWRPYFQSKLANLVLGTQPAALGALPLVRAATDPEARGGAFYGPRWIVWGHPVVETPSRRARRADDARALWERSEQLTGVTFDVPTVPTNGGASS